MMFCSESYLANHRNYSKNHNCGDCLLHGAVASGNMDLVKQLIKCGSDVEALDQNFNTPLFNAFTNNNLPNRHEIIELLLNGPITNNNRIDNDQIFDKFCAGARGDFFGSDLEGRLDKFRRNAEQILEETAVDFFVADARFNQKTDKYFNAGNIPDVKPPVLLFQLQQKSNSIGPTDIIDSLLRQPPKLLRPPKLSKRSKQQELPEQSKLRNYLAR